MVRPIHINKSGVIRCESKKKKFQHKEQMYLRNIFNGRIAAHDTSKIRTRFRGLQIKNRSIYLQRN